MSVSSTDRARLYAWRLRWNAEAIRAASRPQSALLPSGSRLRGIALGNSIVLGRDLHWYDVTNNRATRVTSTVVLSRISYAELRKRFTAAHQERRS